MSKIDYKAQAERLVRIIDIAIECFKNSPPEEFEESHIKRFVDVMTNDKNKVINPEPRFRNIQSLKQLENDTLIFFQETTGKTVDSFWKEISNNNIEIKRVNRLKKVLKRGKINSRVEYDTVIDLYTPYIQSNMLSKLEIEQITDMIDEYEMK
jgi:leucyl aminopeptidase (aminopeptidase T)